MRNRRSQQTAFVDLLSMLAGSSDDVLSQGMLTDRRPDPGLFGPRSVTWRILREPLLLLGGSRALLMQVAHPLVAQGVIDHSRYETEPFDRLLGTSRWVYVFAFGTTVEAREAVDRLRRLHKPVRGKLRRENATVRLTPGTRYDALDEDLGIWVYATLVQSMLVTHGMLIRELSTSDADRFVREWVHAGELLDVRPDPPWNSRSALDQYVDRRIACGDVQPAPGAGRIAHTILRPPLPWPQLAPVAQVSAFITTGLLPSPMRQGYGLDWNERSRIMHTRLGRLARSVHPHLPRLARISPLWDLAMARLTLEQTR